MVDREGCVKTKAENISRPHRRIFLQKSKLQGLACASESISSNMSLSEWIELSSTDVVSKG